MFIGIYRAVAHTLIFEAVPNLSTLTEMPTKPIPKWYFNFNGPMWYVVEMYVGTSLSCLIPLSPVFQAIYAKYFGGEEESAEYQLNDRERGIHQKRLRNHMNDDSLMESTILSNDSSDSWT